MGISDPAQSKTTEPPPADAETTSKGQAPSAGEQQTRQSPRHTPKPSDAEKPLAPLTPIRPTPAESRAAVATTPAAPHVQHPEQLRASHVRILPTSLPYVHDQIMAQRERERDRVSQPSSPDKPRDQPQQQPEQRTAERSSEQQTAAAKSLKPHARSIVDLESLNLERPEAPEPPESLAQVPSQPKRSRKWQFGIRSRNQPYEAVLCLYKALRQQGGVWEIHPAVPGKSAHLFLFSVFLSFFYWQLFIYMNTQTPRTNPNQPRPPRQ